MITRFSGDVTGAAESTTNQRAVSFGDVTTNNTAREAQSYGFKVGVHGVLFPENCMGEVITSPDICPIPHTRNWMAGVMMLRGNLIPVLDLEGLLHETPLNLNKPMILVLDQGKKGLGFILKESPQWLTGLIEIPTTDVEVPDLFAPLVDKIYRRQDSVWLALNKADFFTFLAESAKSC